MRNKKGFTLVELLAVIVLLAIIALIIVQSVTGIIRKAREDTDDVNITRYLRYVDSALAITEVNDGTYPIMMNGDVCIGGLRNDVCNGFVLELELSGDYPTSGTITIKNGKLDDYDFMMGDHHITKDENGDIKEEDTTIASCFISTTPGEINGYSADCPKDMVIHFLLL